MSAGLFGPQERPPVLQEVSHHGNFDSWLRGQGVHRLCLQEIRLLGRGRPALIFHPRSFRRWQRLRVSVRLREDTKAYNLLAEIQWYIRLESILRFYDVTMQSPRSVSLIWPRSSVYGSAEVTPDNS